MRIRNYCAFPQSRPVKPNPSSIKFRIARFCTLATIFSFSSFFLYFPWVWLFVAAMSEKRSGYHVIWARTKWWVNLVAGLEWGGFFEEDERIRIMTRWIRCLNRTYFITADRGQY